MSCWGSRKTPIVEVSLTHVVHYDDSTPKDPFGSAIEFFLRVWGWEFTLRRTSRRFWRFGYVKGFGLGVPYLGWFEWSSDIYPPHQYAGDFTEHLDERRKQQ